MGAGLSGLACALHLLGAGRRVTVVERDAVPGGRASRMRLGAYRLDTGPTVLTMPNWPTKPSRPSATVSTSASNWWPCTPPTGRASRTGPPSTCTPTVRRWRRRCGASPDRWRRRATAGCGPGWNSCTGRRCGASSTPTSTRPSSSCIRTWPVWRHSAASAAGRRGRPLPLRSPSAPCLLLPGPVRRSRPARALAAYAVIAYMDTVAGVWFPKGGMYALPRAMAEAAADAGADLRWSADVSTLERSAGRVTAVRLTSGERIACDAVVLSCELSAAHRLLGRAPRRPVRLRHSPSAVVLHAGTDRTWPGLAHHTLSFGTAWERTFDEIIRAGKLMSDPSLLISRPTAHDATLAPPAGTSTTSWPPARTPPSGPPPPPGGTWARATATAWSPSWSGGAWRVSRTASRRRCW
ncbi:FAD-dependent oxidoreductase [Streptomyces sp. INA 01156]